MKKGMVLLLAASVLCSSQVSAEVIFRYNASVVKQATGGAGGGDVGNPGGGTEEPDPQPPGEPIDCLTPDPSSEFQCDVETDLPSEEAGIAPLRLALVPTPGHADTATYKYRCLQASGGYGNYIYEISGSMPAAVESLDFVTAANPNAPAKGDRQSFYWPGWEGDYDFVTSEANVCLRLSVDSQLDFKTILGRVWIGDYPDSVVENGRVDYMANPYDSEYAVTLRIDGTGTDEGGGECPNGSCDPGTGVQPVECPVEVGSVPFTCIEAEVSTPEADPTGTPTLQFEWLQTPTGAYEDYHGYRCFRVAGGNGNYAILANTDYQPWVGSVNILPYSTPNAPGDVYSMANYPGASWSVEYGGRQFVTGQREFCLRVTPSATYEGSRDPVRVNVTIKDYSAGLVGGSWVPEDQRPDSYLMFGSSLPGDIFQGVQSWRAVDFSARRMATQSRTYGPVVTPTEWDIGVTADTRAEPFYYQCFTYSGGPGTQWHYSVDREFAFDAPSWIEWYDIRPFSQLHVPYQWKDPQSPGSSHQYWPIGMNGENRNTTDEQDICIRIKAVAGSMDKEPMDFTIDRTVSDLDGIPGNLQNLRFYWKVTPL